MTTLPAALGALTAILQSHPLCKNIAILETREFSPDQFYFKVRAELPREYQLQVRLYSNQGHVDYAYQLFRAGMALLRWDNKEEFRCVSKYVILSATLKLSGILHRKAGRMIRCLEDWFGQAGNTGG